MRSHNNDQMIVESSREDKPNTGTMRLDAKTKVGGTNFETSNDNKAKIPSFGGFEQ